MNRYRRKKVRRRAATAVVFSAVLALAVGIPTFAGADPVNGTLNNIGLGSGSGGSSGGGGSTSVTPNAGVPPTYVPPLHGTNPHGQGTVGVIDIQPSDTNPYSGDPSDDEPGSGEDVILGQSRGEQNPDGSYDGKVTLLYLFGSPVVQVTSDPSNGGETQHGPLQPLQEQLLDQVCEGSDGQLCLTVLKMDSTTTGSGSTNQFQLLGATIGGEEGITADVASSEGNNQGCVASGKSNVADVNAGGNPLLDAFQSDSTSDACNGTVTNNSTTLKLGGNDVPIPDAGCPAGTPNTVFDSLAPLLAVVCNADDTNNGQTGAPYGVREALALFALISGDSSLLKVTLGASESHAVTAEGPPITPTTPTQPGGGTKGAGGKGGGKGGGGAGGEGAGGGAGAGAGAGAAAGAAGAGGGQLAFTGADLLALGMVGGALILGGLALTTTAGRRHRQTV